MVEPIMFFGIGFLVASLVGLVIVPLVHARAVRLTMRRLEASIPLSMAEIQADKDQLRAEFAMSTRRLEMSVEQMKAKTASQLAELSRKGEAVNRLKFELGEKTATVFALEAREKALREQLRSSEEEFGIKSTGLSDAERTLADRQSELGRLTAALDERSLTADSQQVELIALRTQVDALKAQVAEHTRAVAETEARLASERTHAAGAAKDLADERSKVENLAKRAAQLAHQLKTQIADSEALGRRLQDMEARQTDQARLLAEREYEIDKLRRTGEAGRGREGDLRAEIAQTQSRLGAAGESYKAEKAQIEGQLAQAREESARLQSELAAMKHETESSWESERVENALLRERINDVAAEVARLTVTLEGAGSPIDKILAEEKPRHAGGKGVANANGPAVNGEQGGNLADRIRALQARASRIPTAAE